MSKNEPAHWTGFFISPLLSLPSLFCRREGPQKASGLASNLSRLGLIPSSRSPLHRKGLQNDLRYGWRSVASEPNFLTRSAQTHGNQTAHLQGALTPSGKFCIPFLFPVRPKRWETVTGLVHKKGAFCGWGAVFRGLVHKKEVFCG